VNECRLVKRQTGQVEPVGQVVHRRLEQVGDMEWERRVDVLTDRVAAGCIHDTKSKLNDWKYKQGDESAARTRREMMVQLGLCMDIVSL
jgi:hypothetical protein